MNTRRFAALFAGASLLLGAAPSFAAPTIEQLLTEDLEALSRRDPIDASRRGDRRFDHLLPDESPQARAAWAADARARLEALRSLDRSAMTDAARLDAALLEHELTQRLEADRFQTWQFAVGPLHGAHMTLTQLPESVAFTSRAQLEAYLQRLEAAPAYLSQSIDALRAGMASGRTPPRAIMSRIPQQAMALGGEDYARDPASHPMFAPFRSLSTDDALSIRARDVVKRDVLPAFTAFGKFLRDEYVPACRQTIGASELPDGAAMYEWMLRGHTTTDLTAEEVHQIGLSEVARIRAEMSEVIARSDWVGRNNADPEARFRGFLDYLRKDDRFYFDRPHELLEAYRNIAKIVDQHMPELFGHLPRLPYGVREMNPLIAPSQTTAYYQSGSLKSGAAGFFVANTYALDQRPKYEMIPLTMHEAVPGHHHQVAIAQELDGAHEWRSTQWFTAFGEGWALYSERLGLEVGESPNPKIEKVAPGSPEYRGLYQDPYDDFGRLTYEMWRAMRLVVDTGLHAKGWTRQQAIDYMLANSGLTKENVEREVDRYIAWPGQATAYKIGEIRIRELRAYAERELGEKFDRRAFHDVVLGHGHIPLTVLEENVRGWVERTRR
ncbi:MAG: DUF885 domain-containing protein [Phycisphaerales bacterium]|nr:DUF885 domain-containing protein [Phycisphaerales bacterium]